MTVPLSIVASAAAAALGDRWLGGVRCRSHHPLPRACITRRRAMRRRGRDVVASPRDGTSPISPNEIIRQTVAATAESSGHARRMRSGRTMAAAALPKPQPWLSRCASLCRWLDWSPAPLHRGTLSRRAQLRDGTVKRAILHPRLLTSRAVPGTRASQRRCARPQA